MSYKEAIKGIFPRVKYDKIEKVDVLLPDRIKKDMYDCYIGSGSELLFEEFLGLTILTAVKGMLEETEASERLEMEMEKFMKALGCQEKGAS